MSNERAPVEVFYSYAHEDEAFRRELEKHLSLLLRQGLISAFHDRQIVAGTDFAKAIDTHLETASLILLLVSSDFLASDYCYGREMKRALERHQANEAWVIPILLRPAEWQHTPLAKLKPLPTNGKSVKEWGDSDAAFLQITQGIRQAVEDINTAKHPQPPIPPMQRPIPNPLSRRKLLRYTGLAGVAGIAVGAVAGFEGALFKKRLTDVRMIIIPSSFGGGLPDTQLDLLRDALSKAFGLPVSVTVGKTYRDSVERFGSGDFNVFWAADYSYVITKAKYDALPILRVKNPSSDDPYYYSYVLTNASSGISTLADLEGKRLSYVDPYSTSGYLFPRYRMHKIGLNEKAVHTNYAQSHNASLESIFNGQADACAVGSEHYKSLDGTYRSAIYTDLLRQYRVDDKSIIPIYKSDRLFMTPIVVHPDISEEDKWRLQSGFFLLEDSTLLQKLGIAGFGSVADKDYDAIRDVAQALGIDLKNA
jgi:phosphate/phosphite/phosphonate ABC transporter binding protein